MRIFLCYVFPPLAVLFCGKPFTAILTLILTVFGWYPGVQHALFIVNNHFQDKRLGGVTKAINNPAWVKKMMEPQQAPRPQYQMPSGPSFMQNPLSWGFRKGQQLAMNGPAGRLAPRSQISQAPQNDDPTMGANGTRFRRK